MIYGWIWLFPDHRPAPMLVLAVTDYSAPVPPNSFASEDTARFKEVYRNYDSITLTSVTDIPSNSAELIETLEEYLKAVTPGGPDENVALIYLSAHGAVNDQGQPCLILPTHDPLDASSWLPMANVLEVLSNEKRLDSCVKVLLLDASRIEYEWRMGIVANTFNLALDSLIQQRKSDNVAVINSARILQSSHAAPELGSTAFGYFVATGLRGAADRDGNGNGSISLAEFAGYLQRRVNQWATDYRGIPQEPTVFGRLDREVTLAGVAGNFNEKEDWSPSPAEQFGDVYQHAQRLHDKNILRLAPIGWARAQFLLDRLDAESIAGGAYAKQSDRTLIQLKSLLEELDSLTAYPAFEPISLSMRSRLTGPTETSELNGTWQEWVEDPNAVKVPQDYDRIVSFAWDRITNQIAKVDYSDLSNLLAFCDAADSAKKKGLEFSEIAFLRLINRHFDWQPSTSLAFGSSLQRLLFARRLSEDLAAPEESQLAYFLAQRLDDLDARQRKALDLVLVGNDAFAVDQLLEGEPEGGLLGSGTYSYAETAKLAELVLRAYRVRDEALATALSLSQLQQRRTKYNAKLGISKRPLELLRGGLRLADHLDELVGSSATRNPLADAARLEADVRNLERLVDESLTAFNKLVSDVRRELGGSDATRNRETKALLRCRVSQDIEWAQLRESWRRRLTTPTESSTEQNRRTAAASGDGADAKNYLRWLTADGLQPLVEALNWSRLGTSHWTDDQPIEAPDVSAETALADAATAFAKFEGRIRSRLTEFPTVCQELGNASQTAIATSLPVEVRTSYSRADVLSRTLAPLVDNRRWFARQDQLPAARLRQVDAQALVLWRAGRTLDDFWGSWRDGYRDEGAYFPTAVRHQLDQAKQILSLPPPNKDLPKGIVRLQERLNAATDALAEWNPLRAEDLNVSPTGDSMVPGRIWFRGYPQLASGVAGVSFEDESQSVVVTHDANELDFRRRGVETGGGTAASERPLDFQLPAEEVSSKAALYAVANFRGHLRSAQIGVGLGVKSVWTKPPPAAARVVVRGDSEQISQLIFIVDCSASMNAVFGAPGENRLEAGGRVLASLLQKLRKQGDDLYEVGLMFYGRRAGWKSRTGSEIKRLQGSGYRGVPGQDVEVAFPPNLLSKRYAERLQDRIEKAAPYGETPLYFALYQGLAQFDSDAGGPLHLIAITDGVNYVVADDANKGQDFTYDRVIDRLDKLGQAVQIDVIEFGGSQEQPSDLVAQGRTDLRKITNHSGGGFYLANDVDKLNEALNDSLKLDQYYLQSRDGRGLTTAPEELGETTTLPPLDSPASFDVRLDEHEVLPVGLQLEGGEDVEVLYQPPPLNRFVFPSFEKERRGRPTTIRDLLVASHMPDWRSGNPVFRFSIQRADETKFTRRPHVVWAQVRPSGESADVASHFFIDAQSEANSPVPLLNFVASGWRGDQLADVNLSFVMDESALSPRVVNFPTVDSRTVEISGATLKVTFETINQREFRVRVDERHRASSDQFPLHIQLSPPPDRIQRAFFEASRLAQHEFFYSVQPKNQNPELRILTRKQINEAGYGPIQFMRVEIP